MMNDEERAALLLNAKLSHPVTKSPSDKVTESCRICSKPKEPGFDYCQYHFVDASRKPGAKPSDKVTESLSDKEKRRVAAAISLSDDVKIDEFSGHPVRGQEPECDPYWCPCPVCQKRMNAQRLLSDKAPTAWAWNYDFLADEVHVSFSLDGVRHKIEHDVARCDCDTRRK